MVVITIDGKSVEAPRQVGGTILEAALSAGIYIPHICAHPDLPSFDKAEPQDIIYRGGERVKNQKPKTKNQKWEGCKLCVVEIDNVGANSRSLLQTACNTEVADGMVVHTNTPEVQITRRDALAKILAYHPHACITCAQKEGCSITQCSTDVPEKERCCPKFGRCELEKIAEYIGVPGETPRYIPQPLPVIKEEPLFERDTNLCIGCLRCVRMCKDVRGVEALGFVYSDDGKPIVGSVAPTLKESGCKFCGGCAEVCPTGAIMDKGIKGEREVFLLPCTHKCPIGIDVARYISYIAEHKFKHAFAVIREKTPFPGILGRICEHPCEDDCRRVELNESIAICAIKRFVTEDRRQKTVTDKSAKTDTGKKVAIVGAGPSGLTAAYYLSRLGHSVSVFDSLPEPGGMMLQAVPRYRLPLELLKEEINEILRNGIEFKNNTTIGKDVTLDDLISRGYDAIFLATGAGLSKRLSIDGIDADGVFWGLDFLKDVNLGEAKGARRIVVVGGGNVAMDAALSSLRLGAKEVQVFCLEKLDEMPAYEWEINQAVEEGIIINCSWGPKRILQNDGRVSGIEFMRCTSVFDEGGKFNPSFDESETTSTSTDMVIVAIGQSSDLSYLQHDLNARPRSKIDVTEQGTIKVKEANLETDVEGIFAGGDVVSGPSSVVEAIADGRKAAISIDKYLGGDGDIEVDAGLKPASPQEEKAGWLGKEEGFAEKPRVEMSCLELEGRRGNFDEVELGFDEAQAVSEANRCLRCELRLQIKPVVLPPEPWIGFNAENIGKVPDKEGVFKLLDEGKTIIYIKGTTNLKQELEEILTTKVPADANYFMYEEELMYTKRESELIQHFLQAHGKMPKYNEELEDLF